MKKKLVLLSLIGFLFTGCTKNNKEVLDRLAAVETKIATLEKALTARPAPQQRATQRDAYDIPVGNSFVLGNPNAPVTLTLFSDYQCPFCEKTHDDFVTKVVEDPELKDKVKVVFKHFPLSFHKQARPAAKFALAVGHNAGSECFWAVTSKLYQNKSDLSDETFKKIAAETKCKHKDGKVAALNANKIFEDYKKNDAKYEEEVKKDMEIGVKSDVGGTPSFYVSGWKLDGPNSRTVEAVKNVIKEKNLLGGAPAHNKS